MPRDHDLLLDPLRARGAHVVLPEHLEHRCPDHPHHDREREHGDRDRRQDELAQVLDRILVEGHVCERRHPAEHPGGEEEQERREPEVGDADADEAADARRVVVLAVALDGREHAERDTDDDGDQEAEEHELGRDRECVDQDLRNRLRVAEREPEVALEDVADPAPVLLCVRPVEAKLLPGRRLLLVGDREVAAEDVDVVPR